MHKFRLFTEQKALNPHYFGSLPYKFLFIVSVPFTKAVLFTDKYMHTHKVCLFDGFAVSFYLEIMHTLHKLICSSALEMVILLRISQRILVSS